MKDILKSLTFDDLPTKPPISGRLKMSDDLQQTIALLSGWDGATRRLCRVTPTGVLYFASPPVQGISNILSDETTYNWQGGNIKTSEVIVRADKTNNDDVWVNVGAVAVANTGYPLDGGEWVNFSITNLNMLHIHIVATAERAIVIYTI